MPGIDVESPAGSAIGCFEDNLCDIAWNAELGSNPCPCAFNISCCVNGLTLSFWCYWDLLIAPSSYRYFFDFGGIYRFYQPGINYPVMNYRIYGSPDRNWWSNIPPHFGTWKHIVIMVQSTNVTVYLGGRFHEEKGLIPPSNGWFPGATRLIPRLKLNRCKGNYSFGQLLMWENWESKRNPVFLWRQHYDEIDANDPEFWR